MAAAPARIASVPEARRLEGSRRTPTDSDGSRAGLARSRSDELDGAPSTPPRPTGWWSNSFLASGGDNFLTLGAGTDKARHAARSTSRRWSTSSTTIGDSLAGLAQRVDRRRACRRGTPGATAGPTVEVDLSSLDFTPRRARGHGDVSRRRDRRVGTAPGRQHARTPLTTTYGTAAVVVEILTPDAVGRPARFRSRSRRRPARRSTCRSRSFERADSTTTASPNKVSRSKKGRRRSSRSPSSAEDGVVADRRGRRSTTARRSSRPRR